MNDDDARIEWIEKCALENIRGHLSSTDHLIKESTTTLTLLFAAASAALAYAVKGMEGGGLAAPATYTSLLISIYVFSVAAMLVWKCLLVGDAQAPTNEPKNLDHPNSTFLAVRKAELKNLQVRILLTVARNDKTAWWLNRLRLAALIGAPGIAVISFGVQFLNHLYA